MQVADEKRPPDAVRPHVKPLDGLRGVAILLVVLPHVALAGMLPLPAWAVEGLATSAHGVDLFFVLSGFGLAFPFVVQRLAGDTIRFDLLTYAFNRVYRILPAFYAALALTYAIVAVAHATGHMPGTGLVAVPRTLYERIAPLLLFDRDNMPIDPALWTIAVQLRWYAVFPLLLVIWLKSPRAFALLLGCVWAGFLLMRVRSIDLGVLPLFMLGIVAADWIARGRWTRYAPLALPFAIAAALAWDAHATVPDAWGFESHFVGQPTSLPWHLAAFALVLAGATSAPFRALLSWAPLRALGAASFSIYLVHQPVIGLVYSLAGPKAGYAGFAVALAAGFAFYWCVERQLTQPSRRRRLRERMLPFVRRAFDWFGLPGVLVIDDSGDADGSTVLVR